MHYVMSCVRDSIYLQGPGLYQQRRSSSGPRSGTTPADVWTPVDPLTAIRCFVTLQTVSASPQVRRNFRTRQRLTGC